MVLIAHVSHDRKERLQTARDSIKEAAKLFQRFPLRKTIREGQKRGILKSGEEGEGDAASLLLLPGRFAGLDRVFGYRASTNTNDESLSKTHKRRLTHTQSLHTKTLNEASLLSRQELSRSHCNLPLPPRTPRNPLLCSVPAETLPRPPSHSSESKEEDCFFL